MCEFVLFVLYPRVSASSAVLILFDSANEKPLYDTNERIEHDFRDVSSPIWQKPECGQSDGHGERQRIPHQHRDQGRDRALSDVRRNASW